MTYSVIIPVYNVRNYLPACIESVLSQTFTDFEVILVDDGSTDGSGELCNEYAGKDDRIKVIHQVNSGLSAARNAGIDAALGEYLAFLDSDDYWSSPQMLMQLDAYIAGGADIAVFGVEILGDEKAQKMYRHIIELDQLPSMWYDTGTHYLRAVLERDICYPWWACRYVFRKSLWKDESVRFPVGKKYEDLATTYKLFLKAGRVVVFPDKYYVYRIGRPDQITFGRSYSSWRDQLAISVDNVRTIEQNVSIEKDVRQRLCENMATGYYAAMIQLTEIEDKKNREQGYQMLQDNRDISKYTATTKQKMAYKMMNIFGMRITVWLLGLRRKVRYGK